jgi:type IX secretion system PorP/SprF family membrane protein
MKKLIYISILSMITLGVRAQQFPFMEAYNINMFNLTPAYAGLSGTKTMFIDYRSDWSGVKGGPVTYEISYNDRYKDKVGLGGRFIYDKADIYKQTMLLGTYTYEVKFASEHFINFGLSAGFYKNSIDIGRYFSDPSFVQDAALVSGTVQSRIKVASDLSAVYRWKDITGGIVFSNVMFGSAKYGNEDISYKPLKNFLVHATYLYHLNQTWDVKPFVLFRGGQHYPSQLELAAEARYNKRFWGLLVFRSGGIWGMGFGGEVYDGIVVNYSYNLSTNVALNTFGSHQITLGVKLFRNKLTGQKEVPDQGK